MLDAKAKLLVVDDEEYNLEILNHLLERSHYDVVSATNGKEALDELHRHNDIDAIVLDRMMPVMDGMALLQRLKQEPKLKRIPVIMQTAASEKSEIEEGIKAGVYYYLTKPYAKRVLLAVVKSALESTHVIGGLEDEVERATQKTELFKKGMGRMQSSTFQYRTTQGARDVAPVVASCFPEPRKVVMGFTELMLNAVEHGNLGLSFEEKSEHLMSGTWDNEVAYRMKKSENSEKKVSVDLARDEEIISVTISDEGAGFDWEEFIELDPLRAAAPNGRGIYLASIDFDELEYKNDGSTVVCTKYL